jgi:phosphoribosylamine---glycine ligase
VKVLIVDTDSCGLSFAWRCAQFGHEVKWFVKPKKGVNVNTGMGFKGINKVDNWVAEVKWADIVVPTGNDDYVERLEVLRKKGAMVFGPSTKSAGLEIKRAEGMKILKDSGLHVPPYKTFPNLKAAERHVWKSEKRYVFKTLGDNEDKSLSYCSKSPADMISRLQRWQKEGMNPKGEVMLQEFVKGIEMGVSAWVGLNGFLSTPNENFEFKPLMPSNCGPNTGEQGTVMAYTSDSKLFNEALKPLESKLVAMGHFGDVDVNVIIDEQGNIRPLEWTCRLGWPAFNIMLSQHKGDPVKWMLDAMRGKDTLKVDESVHIGVVLSQPPYPYGPREDIETEGAPIYGIDKDMEKSIHPQGVKIDVGVDDVAGKPVERKMWTTTDSYVAVVVDKGKTVKEAYDAVYKRVKNVTFNHKIYRDDIGEKLKDELPELHKFGFATHFKYE